MCSSDLFCREENASLVPFLGEGRDFLAAKALDRLADQVVFRREGRVDRLGFRDQFRCHAGYCTPATIASDVTTGFVAEPLTRVPVPITVERTVNVTDPVNAVADLTIQDGDRLPTA